MESNTVNTTPFTLLLRVRYAECDGQTVVFNARYADYIDVAMTEYFRFKMGGFQAILDKGLDNQVVSLHIDWKSSAKFDDVLAIAIEPKKVGNTSFSFDISITNYSSKKTIAKANIFYVLVDSQHYQKITIPDWFKERLLNTSLLPIVDQAGVLT